MTDNHSSAMPLRFDELNPKRMKIASRQFRDQMRGRRSVRAFSNREVDPELIRNSIEAAASAPSGANQQPWHFVVVQDPATKRKIRIAAEAEEAAFYDGRAPAEWLQAIRPLGTDAEKPFLEDAPYLIVIFAEKYSIDREQQPRKNYYVNESVGIATGILITALHHSGLATLTHTPAPMNFLNAILKRPVNERPFLILVVGYPAPDATVPKIERKPLETVMSWC